MNGHRHLSDGTSTIGVALRCEFAIASQRPGGSGSAELRRQGGVVQLESVGLGRPHQEPRALAAWRLEIGVGRSLLVRRALLCSSSKLAVRSTSDALQRKFAATSEWSQADHTGLGKIRAAQCGWPDHRASALTVAESSHSQRACQSWRNREMKSTISRGPPSQATTESRISISFSFLFGLLSLATSLPRWGRGNWRKPEEGGIRIFGKGVVGLA